LTRRQLLSVGIVATAALRPASRPHVDAAPESAVLEVRSIDTTASAYCAIGEELTLLKLINDHRKRNGRSALSLSRTLGAAAEHHSVDMAKRNYFSHTLANGVSWSSNIRNHGYKASGTIGENIAAGHRMAKETFAQWRNSSGHNRNMLNPNFRAIGIGRAYQSASRYDFYWTTTFGASFDAGPLC
jgi:uncharacterized protein YkwD